MPEFKKGDYVKKGDTSGYVVSIAGSNVTWKSASGVVATDKSSDLEQNAGMGAFFYANSPNLIEVVENSAAFCLLQLATGNTVFSKETTRFVVQDSIYELVGKQYIRPYVEDFVDMSKYIPVTKEEDRKAFISSSDFIDAVQKGLVVFGVVDTAWRLFMKQSQSAGRLKYTLKGMASFAISNVYERMMSGNLPFKAQ